MKAYFKEGDIVLAHISKEYAEDVRIISLGEKLSRVCTVRTDGRNNVEFDIQTKYLKR